MARPPASRRTIALKIKVYEDLYASALVALYSEVRGRVPQGHWSALFNKLLEEALQRAAVPPFPTIETEKLDGV